MMKKPGVLILLVVVVLIAAGVGIFLLMQGGDGGTEETSEVGMNGLQFTPSDITVTVGTTVTWTNDDGVLHTVTSKTGLFDSGNMQDGETFQYTFNTIGTYEYECTLHVGMDGVVNVVA